MSVYAFQETIVADQYGGLAMVYLVIPKSEWWDGRPARLLKNDRQDAGPTGQSPRQGDCFAALAMTIVRRH